MLSAHPTELQPIALDERDVGFPVIDKGDVVTRAKQQAAVAYWLSKKYRVAPEPLSALVAEAYEIGIRTKLDPTLILAVMAVESRFNPLPKARWAHKA